MSLPRFFLTEQILALETAPEFVLSLESDDAKHAKVLRLSAGEHIAVIDASKDYFECEIVDWDGSLPIVRIARHEDAKSDRLQVTLVQGLAKGDKMETVIRHATELGVSAFLPMACKRSVMKLDPKKAASKIARWQQIAKSAAMQSGQPAVPEVLMPATAKQTCQMMADFDAVLICWEEAPQTCSLRAALEGVLAADDRGAQRVAVIVGPEGGLAPEEVEALLASNEHAAMVSLGASILRTETAGIVAPALVLYEAGALGSLN